MRFVFVKKHLQNVVSSSTGSTDMWQNPAQLKLDFSSNVCEPKSVIFVVLCVDMSGLSYMETVMVKVNCHSMS